MRGYYREQWDQQFMTSCINDIKFRIERQNDSFSIVLFLKGYWTMDVDYDLVKGIEEIKQEYIKQSNQ